MSQWPIPSFGSFPRAGLWRRVAAATLGLLGAARSAPAARAQGPAIQLRLLAVNDFHGALEGTTIGTRRVGGAAVLGAWLNQLDQQAQAAGSHTIRVAAGDLVGASPPISGLLQDEPAIEAADLMGIQLTSAGNHEFDEGLAELRRLQDGGPHEATGDFPGARLRYLAANVIEVATGQPIFPPYAVVTFDGVPVGFIGIVLRATPTIVMPSGVAGLRFLDEGQTVNRYAAELRAQGVRAIVVLLHQGGEGTVQGGPITGPVRPLVEAEDPDVDVVLSGHTHRPYWGTVAGKLVTQANANGTHVAVVDLVIDRGSGDVVQKQAQIVTAFADQGPGTTPHAELAALVERTAARVAPIVSRVVGTSAVELSTRETAAGESLLGNLIAGAHRQALGAQVAFVNPGGIRSSIPAGPLTYGLLYRAQPFNNDLVRLDLTGAQLKRLLEQQWAGQSEGRVLKCSGITYRWDRRAPAGSRVPLASVRVGGEPLDLSATYSVAVNSFLAEGGDNFTVLREGTNRVVGPTDLDALIAYIASAPQPLTVRLDGRISNLTTS